MDKLKKKLNNLDRRVINLEDELVDFGSQMNRIDTAVSDLRASMKDADQRMLDSNLADRVHRLEFSERTGSEESQRAMSAVWSVILELKDMLLTESGDNRITGLARRVTDESIRLNKVRELAHSDRSLERITANRVSAFVETIDEMGARLKRLESQTQFETSEDDARLREIERRMKTVEKALTAYGVPLTTYGVPMDSSSTEERITGVQAMGREQYQRGFVAGRAAAEGEEKFSGQAEMMAAYRRGLLDVAEGLIRRYMGSNRQLAPITEGVVNELWKAGDYESTLEKVETPKVCITGCPDCEMKAEQG